MASYSDGGKKSPATNDEKSALAFYDPLPPNTAVSFPYIVRH